MTRHRVKASLTVFENTFQIRSSHTSLENLLIFQNIKNILMPENLT